MSQRQGQRVNTPAEQVFGNAHIVLANSVIHGSVQVIDGRIRDISETNAHFSSLWKQSAHAIDCGGDYLIPGLIELHTDHLETHYSPRPGIRWGMKAAIQAHDAQIAAAGITTVYDCLRMGREEDDRFESGEMRQLATALSEARLEDRLRVEHRLHLRCEVSAGDVLDDFAEFEADADVGLVSLMDHSPGQRQFTSMEAYKLYHKTKHKMSDEAFDRYVAVRVEASAKYSDSNRRALSVQCVERGIPMASHDDATLAHVNESVRFGVKMAEFPTTLDAAKASHAAGLGVLMGAPNVVRGRSHSGNVAARTLVENQCLDILSSDYVPASLLQAAFMLAAEARLLSIPQAIATVTGNPARFIGLSDRGEIAEGLRADLVLAAYRPEQDPAPVVRGVWRQGVRVS
ncbi:alpha-D-ribose 1-methylphosphonate 5-triphosphate diphosphatase [Granulosicoccus antarcticus]|uniref:Alpha-D-ribose 1-methylphosphonate 5-triphosphate diphosphatase n=1 Tax=Granulosicoccus antarcticus IMCC3135 TaxID=1192854 RepID=A0A2Z2NHC2_9GAMM|nr:alpha-D-ribose 1-methylphosphonate 5-triphosphate diphosphatase [Granulosicoccus antarcticus]ASJ70539.1 Alpha-D-ribose 1-methylphosphonate 5-triphosphate diphosphatase [Granulosicoccus antarcticus IMCC3135]